MTESGLVFSAGLNDEGQLGVGCERNISWPECIEELSFTVIKSVAAGRYSAAIDEQGLLYVWGHYNGANFNQPIKPDCF